MSLYKNSLVLGYSDSEAFELARLAESFENNPVADVGPDEATEIIVDKFNELGCTSFV